MDFQRDFLKIYPMKAKGIQPEHIPWDDPNYIWEEKYDGDRRLLWITTKKNYNTSRNIAKDSGLPTDKTDNVPHLRDLVIPELHGTVLDGEFDHPLGMDEGIRKIMGCLPDKAVERQKELGPIIYRVYDIIFYKGEYLGNLPLIERKDYIRKVFMKYIGLDNPYIKMVQSYPGGDKGYLENLYNQILDKPFGEGMVAKRKNSKYRCSLEKVQVALKNDWIKVKKGFEGDFIVIGFEPAEIEYDGKDIENHQFWLDTDNNKYVLNGLEHAKKLSNEMGDSLIPITKYHYENWIGSIIFGEYRNSSLIQIGTVSSGINEFTRELISKNKDEYINKVFKLTGFERVKKTGAIKQPVFKNFRDDKDPEECIYENQKG